MTRFLVVASGDSDLAARLSRALARPGNSVASLQGSFATRAEAELAFAAFADTDAVVHLCGDELALVTAPIEATTSSDWDERGERLLRSALLTMQAAHALLTPNGGGRIVLVTATAGITGTPTIVPFVTALEGVRAMAKSAARQWGAVGITVNTVLVSLDLLVPTASTLTPFLPPAAIQPPPDVADVASAITSFAGHTGDRVTGATVIVDGGRVMAP